MFLLDKDAWQISAAMFYFFAHEIWENNSNVFFNQNMYKKTLMHIFGPKIGKKRCLKSMYGTRKEREHCSKFLLNKEKKSKGKLQQIFLGPKRELLISRTKKVREHCSKLLLGQACTYCKGTLRQVPARPRRKETCRIFCWTKTEANTLIGSGYAPYFYGSILLRSV